MKRKNMARNALFTSIISLLLCVSMLVGTTFAWFTDEVTTGMNTIAAGNLDVELYANGAKVENGTKLFTDVNGETIDRWEPGMVVYENLQVKNVGSLALKYQMTLNFGNENELNGHKLSEVLQVAVIDKVAANATRADVLAAAERAVHADGSLSNFYQTGELDAGASNTEQTVVVFWPANENAIDNLYNANNGQTTSDGQPLHIEFGVNLLATQKMSESDSFGNDYDKLSSILPKASVVNTREKTVGVSMGHNAGGEVKLDTSFQFLPNETLDEALSSEYKYYNADFVIKADRDVLANSMALAGYYSAFCGNDPAKNWVALTSPEDITAGTEIRLVDSLATMLGGAVKVSYKDICQFGNDGIGFLCGAADLSGANAGTTITVELRMYETTSDPNSSSNDGVEVGPDAYKVIGRYTHTFGSSSVTGLKAALAAGNPRIELDADLDLKNEPLTITKNTVIDLNGHTITGQSTSSTTSNLIKVEAGATLTLTGNGTINFAATNPDTNWGGEGQPAFPGYANNTINCAGNLVIDGVTIKNSTAPGGASYAIDCYPGANLVINSGTIDGCGWPMRLNVIL